MLNRCIKRQKCKCCSDEVLLMPSSAICLLDTYFKLIKFNCLCLWWGGGCLFNHNTRWKFPSGPALRSDDQVVKIFTCGRALWGGVHWAQDEPAAELRGPSVPPPHPLPVRGLHYYSFFYIQNLQFAFFVKKYTRPSDVDGSGKMNGKKRSRKNMDIEVFRNFDRKKEYVMMNEGKCKEKEKPGT